MIYAHIDDAGNYGGLGEVFAWAVRQLARADLKDLPAGRTELIPGKAWFSIDEPETKPLEQALFEAHREFGGMFAFFFPEDAHRPCVAPGTPRRIRKIVAKIHRSLIPHGELP